MSAKCSSCGAEIVWGVNDKTGSRVPLSVKSKQLRYVFSDDDTTIRMLQTYATHFSDCPQVAQHRKPK